MLEDSGPRCWRTLGRGAGGLWAAVQDSGPRCWRTLGLGAGGLWATVLEDSGPRCWRTLDHGAGGLWATVLEDLHTAGSSHHTLLLVAVEVGGLSMMCMECVSVAGWDLSST